MTPALFALALFATDAPPAPIPPPVAQETADCVRPTYASDQLICADEPLKALDQRVAYAVPPPDAALIEAPTAWFQRSRRCAFETTHRECLVAAYEDRLAQIETAFAPAGAFQRMICDGAWRRRDLQLGPIAAGQVVQLRENGGLVALASPATAASNGWKPFLRWSGGGDRIVFEPLEGRAIACRVVKA